MDIARLGLAVDSSQVEKGTVELRQLTGAAGQASAAARQLAGASQAEAVGQKAATAATRAHTAAIAAQNAALKQAANNRRNLVFQLNDVAVSLASGMNPMMVFMQQGSQIATIYEGGVVPALRETAKWVGSLAVRFAPLVGIIGVVSAGIAGLTYEINKTAETQVGFFDVALAGWELFAEGVAAEVAPVFGALGSWLQQGWDAAAPILKTIGNAMIGTAQAVGLVWMTWPTIMGDAVITTVNVALAGLTRLLNESRAQLAQFLAQVGALPIPGVSHLAQAAVGGLAKPIQAHQFDNPFSGSLGAVGQGVSDAMGQDYLGGAFGALSVRAQEIANRPDEDALKKGAKEAERQAEAYQDIVRTAQQRIDQSELEIQTLGMTAVEMGRLRHEQELLNKAANDNIKLTPEQVAELGALAQAMSVAEEAARKAKEMFDFSKGLVKGFLSDLREGLNNGATFWEAFGNAGMSVLDKIIDKIETNLVDALFSMGGGGGGSIFGWLGSLLGFANGGVFNAGQQIHAFARGGVVDRPTLFPMANGAGLMGEAGPEAIMPLRRGPDGRLGVQAHANQNHANDNTGGDTIYVKAEVIVVDGELVPLITQVSGNVAGKMVKPVSDAVNQMAQQQRFG